MHLLHSPWGLFIHIGRLLTTLQVRFTDLLLNLHTNLYLPHWAPDIASVTAQISGSLIAHTNVCLLAYNCLLAHIHTFASTYKLVLTALNTTHSKFQSWLVAHTSSYLTAYKLRITCIQTAHTNVFLLAYKCLLTWAKSARPNLMLKSFCTLYLLIWSDIIKW